MHRTFWDSKVSYRLLITGGALDEQLVEGVAELVLRGFAPVPVVRRAGKARRVKEPPR